MGLFDLFKFKKKTESSLLILYGTQSGNAKLVAQQTQQYYKKIGVDAYCKNMSGFKPVQLKEVNKLLVIVSTHGEGEPPPSAQTFFNQCLDSSMPSLNKLQYSVCGLGDSSYQEFCWSGKTLDKRFGELGASAFHPRTDCDENFSDDAIQWIKQTASALVSNKGTVNPPEIEAVKQKKQIHLVNIKQSTLLTHGDATAPVYHIVLDTNNASIKHTVGDAIGVVPKNPEWLVDKILQQADCSGYDTKGIADAKEQLISKLEITNLSRNTIVKLQKELNCKQLDALLSDKKNLQNFLIKANVYSLIKVSSVHVKIETLLNVLSRLKIRRYSVASSQQLIPNEIHLTVKTIKYTFQDSVHVGSASTYLNETLQLGSNLEISLFPNKTFCLPQKSNTPIIMIGVSTGIAPFRAILQERKANNLHGNTWLIWGNKYQKSDFLYEKDLRQFKEDGVLEKVDYVFSRDSHEKMYVDKVLISNKKMLEEWLLKGAHIYVCGSLQMGKSVKLTLKKAFENTPYTPTALLKEDRWHEDIY